MNTPTLRAADFSVRNGLVVIEYDGSDPGARVEAERAALRLAVGRTVLAVPVSAAERSPAPGGTHP